jgi:hypothetical protein
MSKRKPSASPGGGPPPPRTNLAAPPERLRLESGADRPLPPDGGLAGAGLPPPDRPATPPAGLVGEQRTDAAPPGPARQPRIGLSLYPGATSAGWGRRNSRATASPAASRISTRRPTCLSSPGVSRPAPATARPPCASKPDRRSTNCTPGCSTPNGCEESRRISAVWPEQFAASVDVSSASNVMTQNCFGGRDRSALRRFTRTPMSRCGRDAWGCGN